MSPRAVERTVITARAPMAPAKTMARGWRMAMMAAMMNVSSPSSETRIMERELPKASPKPPVPAEASWTSSASDRPPRKPYCCASMA